jgi:DNA-directed RNA polymerase specialized sigma24 family protein
MEVAHHEDAERIERARAAIRRGDQQTAQRLAAEVWLRHEDTARAACLRQVRGADMDDVLGIVQLRFVRFVYEGTLRPRSMSAILYQMAAFAYGDFVRGEVRHGSATEDFPLEGHEEAGYATVLDRDLVARLEGELSERERTALLRWADGAPDQEVADELGVKTNNLHQIRFRALARMRKATVTSEEIGA